MKNVESTFFDDAHQSYFFCFALEEILAQGTPLDGTLRHDLVFWTFWITFSKLGTLWHMSGWSNAWRTFSETIIGPGQNKYCFFFMFASSFLILWFRLGFQQNFFRSNARPDYRPVYPDINIFLKNHKKIPFYCGMKHATVIIQLELRDFAPIGMMEQGFCCSSGPIRSEM